MNRRTFGRLTVLGALGALAGATAEAAAPTPVSDNSSRKNYRPTLSSLRSHPSPEWFDDVKFGMFIDYGLYSVAGYAPKKEKGAMYPDWYLQRMYDDPATAKYHAEKWGKDFQRDDFIPLFTADNFDPEKIAQIAEETGMRYVVPFCKHHDGFCLWPSSFTHRNVATMGPKRDLIGPLNDACRKRNLKFGFYFSLEEWEYPVLQDGTKMLRTWTKLDGEPDKIVPYDEAAVAGKIAGKIPVKDFIGDYIIPQANEFVDKYDPDILWLDGDWTAMAEEIGSPEIVSHFYNQAEGRKEVAANDRFGRFLRFNSGDFSTSEYGAKNSERSKVLRKWEECQGASQSFGYNWQDTEKNMKSAEELIDMLVGIVSENGNLLLVVNLDGKGAMPDYMRDRLLEVGRWLK
ncbi:MAG TPA: alpha-L-fucosidase, partial [Opitutaceae bacterium]|nr:alpha-L-fucosidase [Opitutaceae bacterium]